MKILYKGNMFNPTGIATVNREIAKELIKMGHEVQSTDPWQSQWEFNEGLEHLNNSIDVSGEDVVTIYGDYPDNWQQGYGKCYGHFVHEGTRLHPGWSELLNRTVEKIWVPSEATKSLFKWNGVLKPIEVIPHGTNPEIYKPMDLEKKDNFTFLSLNSWSGKIGDRKGTDILIKAFDEEFKEEDVILMLKISTFFQGGIDYLATIENLLGHFNKKIKISCEYMEEERLAYLYNMADCFVSPTRGESFGLTILNAKACGLPTIVTKDINSGHMDFCKDDSTLFIDAPEMEQGDRRYFCAGNMQAVPDVKSLRKQLRYAYEHKDDMLAKAKKNSEHIRKEYTWSNTAKKVLNFIGDTNEEKA